MFYDGDSLFRDGNVSEVFEERASKARVGVTQPWVQIPPPPPNFTLATYSAISSTR